MGFVIGWGLQVLTAGYRLRQPFYVICSFVLVMGWKEQVRLKRRCTRLDRVHVLEEGYLLLVINPLKPDDPYRGRTAPLTSKCCILYIYSTNIGTEYFKHGIYSPFFPLQNALCFIILTYLVPVLFTFYIQGVLK